MKLLQLNSWGIAARLVAIALVPAILMLIAVNVSLYFVAQEEVNNDIRERGRLVAAALAESSQYGVISGNATAVERAARGLLETDRSIASIKVFDAQSRAIVNIETPLGAQGEQTFEAPVEADALDVNLFDTTGGPHVTFEAGQKPVARAGPPVGYVRVVMSPTPLLTAKRERLYLGSALVLLAAMLSGAVGLYLAKRLREPLHGIIGALRRIRQGDYGIAFNGRAAGELGELQAAIADMAKSLGITHQELEDLVATRTQELESAVQLAQTADAEKRRLIARGNVLVEEERRRIALEIHDDLNAALVSIRLEAAALAAKAHADGQSELREGADRIAAVTDDLYRRARNIVKQLRPEVLDTLGLKGAIEEMVRHFDSVHSGCRFEICIGHDLPLIPEQSSIAAYRVVQEALSNVAKYADATRCTVTLKVTSDEASVQLTVADDGRGFDPGARHEGIGLIGMRERADAIGGSMAIESAPDLGTTISLRVPVRGVG